MNKNTAWNWCSKYIRLRDAIAYCKEYRIDLGQFNDPTLIPVKCCSCKHVGAWQSGFDVINKMQAGHFHSRGMGGGSGVYWDERNISAQCSHCNKHRSGAPQDHEAHLKKKYGQKVLDELARKHHIPTKVNFTAIGTYYKLKYKRLLKDLKGE